MWSGVARMRGRAGQCGSQRDIGAHNRHSAGRKPHQRILHDYGVDLPALLSRGITASRVMRG